MLMNRYSAACYFTIIVVGTEIIIIIMEDFISGIAIVGSQIFGTELFQPSTVLPCIIAASR